MHKILKSALEKKRHLPFQKTDFIVVFTSILLILRQFFADFTSFYADFTSILPFYIIGFGRVPFVKFIVFDFA